jgi:hypothetical protein
MKLFGSQEKPKEKPSVLPLAAVIAVLGGVGAAVLSSSKGKKVRDSLQEVGDDVVDVLERVLNKVDSGKNTANHGLGEFSKIILSTLDEMKALNASVEPPQTPVQKIEEKVVSTITKVENVAVQNVQRVEAAVEDDLSEAAQWFQKKAKSLAKRSFKS